MNARTYAEDTNSCPRYAFHQDAGHGWLEVPLDLIDQLGLKAAISGYSYMNGTKAYLEEDSDLAKFMAAYKARFGVEPEIAESYGRHPKRSAIRDYSPYSSTRYIDTLKKRG